MAQMMGPLESEEAGSSPLASEIYQNEAIACRSWLPSIAAAAPTITCEQFSLFKTLNNRSSESSMVVMNNVDHHSSWTANTSLS